MLEVLAMQVDLLGITLLVDACIYLRHLRHKVRKNISTAISILLFLWLRLIALIFDLFDICYFEDDVW